jgi:prevent-host-death family protein
MRRISAAEANRHFSRILSEVRSGESIVVTSRGAPVATILPVGQGSLAHSPAKDALLERLRRQSAAGISWSREELYESDA